MGLRWSEEQYAQWQREHGQQAPNRPTLPAAASPPTEQKARKYGNKVEYVDGRKFDSRKEASRYRYLSALQAQGEIRNLRCQVRYPLEVNGIQVGLYVADFVYVRADGESVVEDVKGWLDPASPVTKLFRLKEKLLWALHGIKVEVV